MKVLTEFREAIAMLEKLGLNDAQIKDLILTGKTTVARFADKEEAEVWAYKVELVGLKAEIYEWAYHSSVTVGFV